MKIILRYKGGKGSGFHGHAGGIGGIGNPGGSQSIGEGNTIPKTISIYNSLHELVSSKTAMNSKGNYYNNIFAFFVDTDSKILATNPDWNDETWGTHEKLSNDISKMGKYPISIASKGGYEKAAVKSGSLIRCEYSRPDNILYIEADPFTKKHLYAIQGVLNYSKTVVRSIVIENYTLLTGGGLYKTIKSNEFTLDEFMVANDIIISNDTVDLKEYYIGNAMKIKLRYKGGEGSGDFGHIGRPGTVGGSGGGKLSIGGDILWAEKFGGNYFTSRSNRNIINKFGGEESFAVSGGFRKDLGKWNVSYVISGISDVITNPSRVIYTDTKQQAQQIGSKMLETLPPEYTWA